MLRVVAVLAVLLVAAFAVWHPAPGPAIAVVSPAPTAGAAGHRHRSVGPPADRGSAPVVYVVGAVARPGLYRLQPGARVDDAVRAAGGLVRGADPQAINLAAHVADGDEIAAPLLGAPTTTLSRRSAHARAAKRGAKTPVALVNVNHADAAALEALPGIGATLAARIVQVRELDGPYDTLDQLLDVAGMTAARLDRVRPYLTL
jgi:competence protein ComEA